MAELKSEMSKEVAKLDEYYSTLRSDVDVIIDAVKKVVMYFTSLSTIVDSKPESDSKVFAKLEAFLLSLTKIVSKLDFSPNSSVSQESLFQLFSYLETSLKAKLTPLLKFLNLMPTDSPPIKTCMQGVEKEVGLS